MKVPKTVLICTLGRTPQVLVETVWALANRKEPVVPDEIVAVSMANFSNDVKDSVFGNGKGWSTLLAKLKSTRISVTRKLRFSEITIAADDKGVIQDLRTTEDNTRCANYLFSLIRKYTMDDSSRIILSLSGGRKSLSALTTVVMSLLARPEDELIHLIADRELEDGRYHFPRGARGYSLFEIPFVRTRGLLKRITIDRVQTFEECLRLTQGEVPDETMFTVIMIDMGVGSLRLGNGRPVRPVDPARLMLLWLIFREKILDRDRFRDMLDGAKKLADSGTLGFQGKVPEWFSNLRRKDRLPEFRQIIDWTKKKVLGERLGLSEEFCRALLPNSNGVGRVFDIGYPKDLLLVNETDFSNWLYAQIKPQS